uniref:Uncharacterized protein n=1 Tax=Romanomermis culicivorax TaxID=13658 RepID=A0A915JKV9_ROMCU
MTILPKKKSSNSNRDSRTVQCSSSSVSNAVERSNDQSADAVVQSSSVHHRRHYLNEVTVTEAENIVVSSSGVSLPHRKRSAM